MSNLIVYGGGGSATLYFSKLSFGVGAASSVGFYIVESTAAFKCGFELHPIWKLFELRLSKESEWG